MRAQSHRTGVRCAASTRARGSRRAVLRRRGLPAARPCSRATDATANRHRSRGRARGPPAHAHRATRPELRPRRVLAQHARGNSRASTRESTRCPWPAAPPTHAALGAAPDRARARARAGSRSGGGGEGTRGGFGVSAAGRQVWRAREGRQDQVGRKRLGERRAAGRARDAVRRMAGGESAVAMGISVTGRAGGDSEGHARVQSVWLRRVRVLVLRK